MTITIKKSTPSGIVTAPPSKSAGHRALICAALSPGESVIHGISDSDDMKATLDCVSALGAVFRKEGNTVTIRGCQPQKRSAPVTLPCRESGSTLRFMIPLCMLSEASARLTGSRRLMERPLDVYRDIADAQGLTIQTDADAVLIEGRLTGGHFQVAGDISSQFISGLMFALPLLPDYSIIQIKPPVLSAPYLRMTAEMLEKFGVRVTLTEDNRIIIPGNQSYEPREITVEGDWSNSAFFMAMEALGFPVEVEGLTRHTEQGDSVIVRYLAKLCRTSPTLDIADCPDLAPILMATAAARNGAVFLGTDRLKIKESDRGQAMAEELQKFGVPVLIGNDTITVKAPKTLLTPEVPLNGHNDHRIVMACAVLSLLTGAVIEGAEAVNKSYPDFFDDFFALCRNTDKAGQEQI